MTGFSLELFQQQGSEHIDDVALFVGEDRSGRFGIAPHHDCFITELVFGLARVRLDSGETWYLALPGGLLHFEHNTMTLHTRRYWRGADYARMQEVLQEDVKREADRLHQLKSNMAQIEDSMLRRLLELERRR